MSRPWPSPTHTDWYGETIISRRRSVRFGVVFVATVLARAMASLATLATALTH